MFRQHFIVRLATGVSALFSIVMLSVNVSQGQGEQRFPEKLNVKIDHISTDKSVNYNYDIVYVRAQRAGDEVHNRFYTDFSQPVTIEAGADLMLLHPDGSEERLVEGGAGSVTDPFVSFDGQWVYYSLIYNLEKRDQWNPPRQGADIFKIHLQSRKIVRLTNQKFTPNTGAAPAWSDDFRDPGDKKRDGKTWYNYGVFNIGACPLPGGKIAFTSNRDGFRPAKGYPQVAFQLFVMDDRDDSIDETADPPNLTKIGHLNISGALHPVPLKDGRIMYSSLESQGIRSNILWGIWTIHPDGSNWAPLVSAFDPGGAPNGFHFQTQLSSGEIVFEEYYNQNNSGFGSLLKMPAAPTDGYAPFGPGNRRSERNKPWRFGRHYNAKPRLYRMPFMPTGSVSLTPFATGLEGQADPSVYDDKESPRVGKFTHPSAAPNNHLLTVYSPGPVNHQYTFLPQLDGGIYLLKNGDVIDEPGDLLLIKNDPKYNESWPRAVVPYSAVHGVEEPAKLPSVANDGKLSAHLPAGTPFGLVGSSSFYKRESYPDGDYADGSVTAAYPGGNDPWKGLDAFTSHGNRMPLNWHNQGSDAGLYTNSEIHAVRVLAMEPTTDRDRGNKTERTFYSHANERLRILGEIPLRKFVNGKQPLDPDGNPDTSFLAKIPADTAFTFQTIDKNGLLLNMSQTWHQLRPGEVRTDCGGCHAHSQAPTHFADTAAAAENYPVWDLTELTPLIGDAVQSKSEPTHQYDVTGETLVNYSEKEVVNVEYHRDVQPILQRSCIACHTSHDGKTPAGNLDLAADDQIEDLPYSLKLPGAYYRIAADEKAKYGHKPPGYDSWGYPNASRTIRKFQARRSLLVWKLYGKRLDGFHNDDHPSESKPGKRDFFVNGEPVDAKKNRHRWDIDYVGSIMPPPAAVKEGKVKPLSDDDRRTITRWIDLGCPIDLDYNPEQPNDRGYGWMLDDNRPILTIAEPSAGMNAKVDRILLGMHDYDTGLDLETFTVNADIPIDGQPAGAELNAHFRQTETDVWEWKLTKPLAPQTAATLTVAVKDKQGNVMRTERRFSSR